MMTNNELLAHCRQRKMEIEHKANPSAYDRMVYRAYTNVICKLLKKEQ